MSFEFHSSQLFVLQKRLAGFMRNKSLPTGHAQSFPLRGQRKGDEEKGRERGREQGRATEIDKWRMAA